MKTRLQSAFRDSRERNRLPRMAAALMPRELKCWSFCAIALGALEGGLLGVLVKTQFAHAAAAGVINVAVALAVSAPALTNLTSFFFARWARGKDKPALISRLMRVIAVCLIGLSLVPINTAGLIIFCALIVLSRSAWAGVLTIRAAVWRANYERQWRARVTARIVQISSVLVAAFAALVGFSLEWHPWAFRVLFVLAAISILLAAHQYQASRVRRQGRLLAAELAEQSLAVQTRGVKRLWQVLASDQDFRRYMGCMMVFGSGNLMLIPLLIVLFGEQQLVAPSLQVVLTSSLPLLVLFTAVRFWAGLLDKRHIFSYRAIHSWFYVLSMLLFLLSVWQHEPLWLWPASVTLGLAHAGAYLGWNLGHNDFSSDANAAQYMAIHVTLTGIRGLIMPLVAIGFYQYLVLRIPDMAAPVALLLPLSLSLSGALGFVFLSRLRSRQNVTP